MSIAWHSVVTEYNANAGDWHFVVESTDGGVSWMWFATPLTDELADTNSGVERRGVSKNGKFHVASEAQKDVARWLQENEQ